MNEFAIEHIPESKYCFAEDKNTVTLRLRVSKYDMPEKVEVVYGGKYDYATVQLRAIMKRYCEDKLFAYYTATLHLADVRLVYIFAITENGKEYYFSEDGLTEHYDYTLNYYNCFQLAYVNDIDVMKPIEWLKTATFYQIFVERFNIGLKDKDKSYINLKWGELPKPKSFAGGDIKGITEKLNYINDLGINALYLTPVFSSISNHKYDISDYYNVDKNFGSKDDLKELIDKAHAMGMKIVLDAVFNHCSDQISQFQDVLKNGRKSKFYDWFIITNDNPLQYECFASCKYMPKFNTSKKEVCEYLIDIATYWIKEFDIDGWRLDVSDEISHEFWRQFRRAVKEAKPDCVLIGENWHDANVYLQGDQYDSIMNYAFTKACLDFYAFKRFTPKWFVEKLNELLMRNCNAANSMLLNLLDSHDTHRFFTQVNCDKDKLLNALSMLYFFDGVPCIYYGTEIALQGYHDPDSRRTFEWDKVDSSSTLTQLIKYLCSLKANGELADNNIVITEHNGIIEVVREKYKLILNGNEFKIKYTPLNKSFAYKYANGELDGWGFVIEKI